MNPAVEPPLVSSFSDAINPGKEVNSTFETILSALQSHVAVQPHAIAYTFLRSDTERETRTYQQLDHRARQIATGLLQYADPGDRALMAYPAGLDFIEAFLGCLYAGIVAVPAYPPKKNRNADRVLAIANDCTPRLLLCSRDTRSNVDGDFAATVSGSRVIATDELKGSPNDPLPLLSAEQLAFLQYTSGSTATPKGVMVSHGNIVANERLIERSFGFSSQSVMVSWLPMFHDMGLIGGILAPLFVGFPSVLMAPNVFLREPVKWLQAVTEFRATTTGAPNFAYDLCVKKITTEQKAALDLSTLQVAYNGAEPVRAETLRSFSRAFRDCGFNESAFFPCYGMAETTLLVSGGPPLADTPVLRLHSEALENHRILEISNGSKGHDCVGCGQIRAELQVRIVHPETGKECAADEVGEIWVHGKSVAQGYFNLSDETAEIFQARIAGDNRNWLRTGDSGFVIKNELFVTGRLKDLIIVRGRNIYPQDIEQLAEQHLRFIEPNAAAAFSVETDETVRLVLVAEGTREMVRWSRNASKDDAELTELNLSIDAFRQALAEQLEVVLDDIIFVRPTTFPRTSSGKVQRQLTKKWLQEGKLETVIDYAPPKRSVSTERADNAIAWLREFSERRLNSYVADERRTLPPHVILELGNKGLLGMQATEEVGGLNLKTFDVMRVMEQLAAIDMSIASVVGVHNGLGLRPLLNFGTVELKAELLPVIASGRQLASFGLSESASGSNPMAMQSFARPAGYGWNLTAHKQWIGLAQWAGTIHVFARRLDKQGRAAGGHRHHSSRESPEAAIWP